MYSLLPAVNTVFQKPVTAFTIRLLCFYRLIGTKHFWKKKTTKWLIKIDKDVLELGATNRYCKLNLCL